MHHISYNKRLYKIEDSKAKLAPSKMNSLQWFSLTKNYGGTNYGTIGAKYVTKRSLVLYDIGKQSNRKKLIDYIVLKHLATKAEANDILNPDEQYSGSAANRKAHKLIQKAISSQYDGTYIDMANAPPEDDLAGASEVVLWPMKNRISLKNLIRRTKFFKAEDE